jgi:hypothetical protein
VIFFLERYDRLLGRYGREPDREPPPLDPERYERLPPELDWDERLPPELDWAGRLPSELDWAGRLPSELAGVVLVLSVVRS